MEKGTEYAVFEIPADCPYCFQVMNMMESIWKKNGQLPRFPKLEQERKTDVLILGGGMAGLLCARLLTDSGLDCTLIEADRICGGITGNTTAKITAQHGLIYGRLCREFGPERTKLYWQANDLAVRVLSEMAEGCDLERKPHYVYATRSLSGVEDEWDVLDELRIPAEYAPCTELPFPVLGAVRFPDQAQFHPLKFAAKISGGLQIFENTKALELAPGAVRTEAGWIRAEKIIVATHFPILNRHGGYFLKLYQDRSYVLALENLRPPEGMYLAAEKDGLSLRSCGDRLLLGGGSHRTGTVSHGWRDLERFAREYYPNARETDRWAAQDCMTLDGIPYIGQYGRRTPNLYVATGFNKWGMTGSLVAAMLLRDQLLGRKNPFRELFSPRRSCLRPQLAVNALESAKNLLTLRTPRCPHLGCALKWNPLERSWDCPCHGSRFSEEGKRLDGPATGDLE